MEGGVPANLSRCLLPIAQRFQPSGSRFIGRAEDSVKLAIRHPGACLAAQPARVRTCRQRAVLGFPVRFSSVEWDCIPNRQFAMARGGLSAHLHVRWHWGRT